MFIQFFKNTTKLVGLIKPQFEAGRSEVEKGGIVRSELVHQKVIKEVESSLESLGLIRLGLIKCPLRGTDGNQEYLGVWELKK